MSLVKTLAKVAVGIAVAKGMGKMVAGAQQGGGSGGAAGGGMAGRAGSGTSYGGPMSRGSAGGGLVDALGKILSQGGPRGRGSLGGALEELSRRSTEPFSQKTSHTTTHTGGASEAPKPFEAPKKDSFGDVLNQSLDHYGEPKSQPSADQEKLAGLLLRALIQAAKADGQIDASEKQKLMEHMGELDQSDVDFITAELEKPVDAAALARDVPKGAEAQVYMMSLMGIDLDTKQEARYLYELAQAMGVDAGTVNAIHDRLGEPRITA